MLTSPWVPYVFVLIGLVGLFIGGEIFVRSAVNLGHRMGVSPLFVGLAIVGFGTSSAELAVSVSAALDGAPDIALANVVGSNIANIALVLGLTATITALAVERGSLARDIPVMIGVTIVLLAFLYDDVVTRIEGAVLLLTLFAYLTLAWFQSKNKSDPAATDGDTDEDDLGSDDASWTKIILLLAVGAILLASASQFLVDGAVAISISFAIPQAVIGATVVAVGTSLPEIAASTLAAVRGHTALALGNIVGSNIWNIVCVLGTTAVITDLPRGGVSWDMLAIVTAVSVLLFIIAKTGHRITRTEGIVLLVLYFCYQFWLFLGV